MRITTFEAKCADCKTIFEHPSLGDFAYGEFIFSTIDGSDFLCCDANEVSESILQGLIPEDLTAEQFQKTLVTVVDNPFASQLTLRIPCTKCGSTNLEYWEGQKIGVRNIEKATFKRFSVLSEEEKLKEISTILDDINRCCSILPNRLKGQTVSRHKTLSTTCDRVQCEVNKDTRYYRCRICHQLWEEQIDSSCAYGDSVDSVKIWSLPKI